jgi:hypothetical protein
MQSNVDKFNIANFNKTPSAEPAALARIASQDGRGGEQSV